MKPSSAIDPFTATGKWLLTALRKSGINKLNNAGATFGKSGDVYVINYKNTQIGSYATKDEYIKALKNLLKRKGDDLKKHLDEAVQAAKKNANKADEASNAYRKTIKYWKNFKYNDLIGKPPPPKKAMLSCRHIS